MNKTKRRFCKKSNRCFRISKKYV